MTDSTARADIEAELIGFFESTTGTKWRPDDDLFVLGAMNSMFALQLVMHLEGAYAVMISGADLDLGNFRTIGAMATMVVRLRESGAAEGADL